MRRSIALVLAVLVVAMLPPPPALAQGASDVADVPSEKLAAGGNERMQYFLIGPKAGADVPPEGYSLLVVMPGGDGSADFAPFVKRIFKYALPDGYIAAQPVAVKWSPKQGTVWPTKKSRIPGARFTTEEFVEAVIADVKEKYKVNPARVFTFSWSSSGPAAYATSLQRKTAVVGAFVAMSVFIPETLPPLTTAKGRFFYIYHSPEDMRCLPSQARLAQESLLENGAKVRFVEYPGGHGWTSGNIYGDIRAGIGWLEDPVMTDEDRKIIPQAAIPFADGFEEGNILPDGWEMWENPPGVTRRWDRKVGHDSRRSLYLEKTLNKFLPPYACWGREFKHDGRSRKVTVSAFVKARDVTKAIIDVQFVDRAGNWSHKWAVYVGSKEAGEPPATHDWKKYSGTVDVPRSARRLAVALQIYGPGAIWFDDVEIEYAR